MVKLIFMVNIKGHEPCDDTVTYLNQAYSVYYIRVQLNLKLFFCKTRVFE